MLWPGPHQPANRNPSICVFYFLASTLQLHLLEWPIPSLSLVFPTPWIIWESPKKLALQLFGCACINILSSTMSAYKGTLNTIANLVSYITKLMGNGIPTPLGKPDERKMRRSKAAKRVFFIYLSRPEGTQEKVYELIANTYRCSRIAIASVPGG